MVSERQAVHKIRQPSRHSPPLLIILIIRLLTGACRRSQKNRMTRLLQQLGFTRKYQYNPPAIGGHPTFAHYRGQPTLSWTPDMHATHEPHIFVQPATLIATRAQLPGHPTFNLADTRHSRTTEDTTHFRGHPTFTPLMNPAFVCARQPPWQPVWTPRICHTGICILCCAPA